MPSTAPSNPTEELPEEERQQRAGEAVNRLGHWLLSSTTTDPGWDQLIADIKPSRREPGSFLARITELRGEREVTGSTGLIDDDSNALPLLREHRRATYTRAHGAWLSISLIIQAEGWPVPEYQVGIDTNHDDEPESWGQESPLAAEDLVGEWETFPRDRIHLPEWMVERTQGYQPEKQVTPSPDEERHAHPIAPSQFDDAYEDSDTTPESLNPQVEQALSHFAHKPTEQTIANVLRCLMGGEVLLDITGSTLVPGPRGERVGPGSQVRVQAVLGNDGRRSLAVYLREETARNVVSASGRSTQELMLNRESGVSVLQNFVADETLSDIIVEPNSPDSCRIEGPQAEWAMNTPRNDAAKNALLAKSMQRLIGSFMGPGSVLLLGMRESEQGLRPVFAQPEGDGEPQTFLLFTSAPEVAALDPQLQVRSVPALDAMRLAVESGATHVKINALGPSALLPMDQVREILEIAALQEKVRTRAS
ncbi:SseB family protein [Rothia sp. HC945]|uniref:SseB family protein n=1 Tax=Rothia sp. HC945 TaxID=3171170 RepID=UPI00264B2105|nr:SseB family protein [Kocuria sp.]MDN5616885.1 SseB family protein [Kocuria sp.]MDN5653870.1 SseB family protein [Kocuria sp.]